MQQTPDIGTTISDGYQRGLDRISDWLPPLAVVGLALGAVGGVAAEIQTSLVPDAGDIFRAALEGRSTGIDEDDLRTANLVSGVYGAISFVAAYALYSIFGGILHRERHGGEVDVPNPATVLPRLFAQVGRLMPKLGLLAGVFLAAQVLNAVLGVLGALVAIGIFIWFAYMAIRWIYAPIVVGSDEATGDAAFARSEQVVDGAWWGTLGCWIVIGLATGLPIAILGFIVSGILPGAFLGALGSAVVTTVLGVPIVASALESAWAQVEGGAGDGELPPADAPRASEPAEPAAPAADSTTTSPGDDDGPPAPSDDRDDRSPFV